eukprot:scaffold98175_cov35-Tisochrysis_lutea.AAC.1
MARGKRRIDRPCTKVPVSPFAVELGQAALVPECHGNAEPDRIWLEPVGTPGPKYKNIPRPSFVSPRLRSRRQKRPLHHSAAGVDLTYHPRLPPHAQRPRPWLLDGQPEWPPPSLPSRLSRAASQVQAARSA